jgi:hypothetical protein
MTGAVERGFNAHILCGSSAFVQLRRLAGEPAQKPSRLPAAEGRRHDDRHVLQASSRNDLPVV